MIDPASLSPALLWKHFLQLSAIPRPSSHEQAAAAHVEGVARSLGLASRRDAAGNVLVTKPASPGMESLSPVILQAHLDMVPQRAKSSSHDFLKDPIRLIHEGDWVRADGTTLGADNGIGAAAALAVLESTELRHGPLSALFTVEEEIGLRGAAKVPADFLNGDFLINLDADSPEELIIGCAGATDLRIELPCRRQQVPSAWKGLRVTLGGLAGGHSGADIHRGRANAVIGLARILGGIGQDFEWRLATLKGGDARNAIPREAEALLVAPESSLIQLQAALEARVALLRNEYREAEPTLSLTCQQGVPSFMALDWASAQTILDFLRICPNGAFRFSDIQPGVVETSSNVGVFQLSEEGNAAVQCLIRSSVDSAKDEVSAATAALVRLAGGTALVYGNYPGWQPASASRLVPVFASAISRRLSKQARIAVVHGGLECGLLRATRPSLDCVSCGPLIQDMHSPDERVSVSSVAAFWDILVDSLARIPTRGQ